jgi:hypothetical protein
MEALTIGQVLEQEALALVLSDVEGLNYGDVMESLENGEFPDDLLVWEPFENCQPNELAETLEGFYDALHSVVNRLETLNLIKR